VEALLHDYETALANVEEKLRQNGTRPPRRELLTLHRALSLNRAKLRTATFWGTTSEAAEQWQMVADLKEAINILRWAAPG
jgi:hypothetical protein